MLQISFGREEKGACLCCALLLQISLGREEEGGQVAFVELLLFLGREETGATFAVL